MKKIKVLIVEDNESSARRLNNQVLHLGYEVTGVADCLEKTISNIEVNKPDLVLIDVDLKGNKSGIDTALDIYKRHIIPILFIGEDFSNTIEKQLKIVNNSAFLPKSTDEKILGEKISALLRIKNNNTGNNSESREEERLKALHRYEILDTPVNGNFDKITEMASLILDVPIAVVSLVDKDRIWYKSQFGVKLNQVDREPHTSTSAILPEEFFSSTNEQKDFPFIADSLMASENGFHFYAAAPLLTHDGHNLGTLSIMDKEPKALTVTEEKILKGLADIVMDEIELRLASRKAVRLQSELLSIAAHDLKNPTAGIMGLSEIMTKEEDTNSIREMALLINKSSTKMLHIINELMEISIGDGGKIKLNLTSVDMAEILQEVIEFNIWSAKLKEQHLELIIKDRVIVKGDKEKMREIFDNLLSNAIKYSQKGKKITVRIYKKEEKANIEIEDDGLGLSKDDKLKLFGRFSRLSSQPTGGESSTGLGLSIVKMLVELHNGRIRAESDGKNKGSKFMVEFNCETE